MIDEVMFEIRELTGQVYKNVYAGKPSDPGTPVASIRDTESDVSLVETDVENSSPSTARRNGSMSAAH